jgi:hypothetical protein
MASVEAKKRGKKNRAQPILVVLRPLLTSQARGGGGKDWPVLTIKRYPWFCSCGFGLILSVAEAYSPTSIRHRKDRAVSTQRKNQP